MKARACFGILYTSYAITRERKPESYNLLIYPASKGLKDTFFVWEVHEEVFVERRVSHQKRFFAVLILDELLLRGLKTNLCDA